MSGNANLRWFLLAPLLVALFVVVASPVVSWSGELEDAKERVRQNPNDAEAHFNLGLAYRKSGQIQEAIRIKPDHADAHYNLGLAYYDLGRYQEAIASYKEALRINPDLTIARNNLNKLEQKTADEGLALEQHLLEEERKRTRLKQWLLFHLELLMEN